MAKDFPEAAGFIKALASGVTEIRRHPLPKPSIRVRPTKSPTRAKEKVGHGGFWALFLESNASSEGVKNDAFAFDKRQAQRYMRVATFPALARQALLEDQGERFKFTVGRQ